MVPVVGLGRFLRLFWATMAHFCSLLKPTLDLQEPTRDLQFADDSADGFKDTIVSGGLRSIFFEPLTLIPYSGSFLIEIS